MILYYIIIYNYIINIILIYINNEFLIQIEIFKKKNWK